MIVTVADIRENIAQVTERIASAARTAGRSAQDVRLVVVTKAQPVEILRAAVEAGAKILGENYPQESQPKIEALGRMEGVEWHMIGHLQSRKAPIVAQYFDALQSLDSLSLAEKLDRRLAEVNRVLPVLLEFNVGGEESKYGWNVTDEASLEHVLPEIEAILRLPNLRVRGLMTMPPLYGDPLQTRPFFERLRLLGDSLGRRFGAEHFRELSMGTSADYEVAVQEGATLVRVGTAILGPRPPRNQA